MHTERPGLRAAVTAQRLGRVRKQRADPPDGIGSLRRLFRPGSRYSKIPWTRRSFEPKWY
ncbi:hypothetical protein ABZY09_13510 [Streptomyces sp. NPDC002928]|uniref:hypothetical protein n=1 Tax=Streptomyces sp. NPDC002928 TaxID=3154440 RepID=UPI0033B54205